MSNEENIKFLNEYNDWVVEKRYIELTPENFVIDRAKQQALERVLKTVDKIKELQDIYYQEELFDNMDDMASAIDADLKEMLMILEGEDG